MKYVTSLIVVDWTSGANRFSFQADIAEGKGERVALTRRLTPPFDGSAQEYSSFAAGNSMLSWTRAKSSGVESSLQVYYAGFARSELGEKSHTMDVDARQRRNMGKRHDVVGGLQYRFTNSVVEPTPIVTITPSAVRAHLVTAFLQDEISLTSCLRVTAGTKVEVNQDTGFELQPSVRALWRLAAAQSVWGAVSRAVRTPNRFERGMYVIASASQGQGPLPVVVALQGSPATSSEIVTAYEAGYRATRGAFSADVTTFAGSYDDPRRRGYEHVESAFVVAAGRQLFVAPREPWLAITPSSLPRCAPARTASWSGAFEEPGGRSDERPKDQSQPSTARTLYARTSGVNGF